MLECVNGMRTATLINFKFKDLEGVVPDTYGKQQLHMVL